MPVEKTRFPALQWKDELIGKKAIPATNASALAANVKKAKEVGRREGRQEGRANAYKELALDPGEQVNSLVQSQQPRSEPERLEYQ